LSERFVSRDKFQLTSQQAILYWIYVAAWHVALPAVLLYFWLRGRKEPLYRQYWAERFGLISTNLKQPIWIHSASLGELRGVMPLIDRMLAENQALLITTLTPAGREAAQNRYANSIAGGKLQVSYLPLELPWAVKSFAKKSRARCMISSEIDTWPVLLHSLNRLKVPLAFINAQYPQKSFEKDKSWGGFRAAFFRAYSLVLCKSDLHAKRFLETRCANVQVVGELRFDLPIPKAQPEAAEQIKALIPELQSRGILCIASVVEGEDEWMIGAYIKLKQLMQAQHKPSPLLVYVPRNPQRFDIAYDLLHAHGLLAVRRSQVVDSALKLRDASELRAADVLLGDSLGEMYFYLALASSATVCGSFLPRGSHNVIEPLALQKKVVVGPSIWGIEYPGQEALAAGVLTQVQSAAELPACWYAMYTQTSHCEQQANLLRQFYEEHSGSVERHWQRLKDWLPS
jgi:3-deoxy-D-manno-octulosonic-acid transferase